MKPIYAVGGTVALALIVLPAGSSSEAICKQQV